MELILKLLNGRSAGKEIKVQVSKFLIGRADDCHLRPHSDLVSRHHCVLLVEEGFCAVRDFGSRNGTFVNDERLVGQRELRNGDHMKVGVLEFEVQLTSRVGGKKLPKVKNVKEAAQRTAAAAVARKGDEDDISDWLGDDEGDVSETRRVDVEQAKGPPHETPAPTAMPTRDTVFMKTPTEETTAIKPQKPAEPPAAAAPSDSEQSTRRAEAAQRLFGKPQGPHKGGSANSRDAAADALKKIFGSKKQ
jgi:predicted component of type VI protein secretion system